MLQLTFQKRVKDKAEIEAFRSLVALKYPRLMEGKLEALPIDSGRVGVELEINLKHAHIETRSNKLFIVVRGDTHDSYSIAELSKEFNCYVLVEEKQSKRGATVVRVDAKSGVIIGYVAYEPMWVENDVAFYNDPSVLVFGTQPICNKCPKCGSSDVRAKSESKATAQPSDILEQLIECGGCGAKFAERWGFIKWYERGTGSPI